ncbi:MAG: prepilin-type N-terminal cleavage/methylation domain-containing protein [Pirellulaceae bacterium]|nr:prepilin-type N-terminal cleavage/methylation domain-containing protein [Pirellulaceae bacterium]
MSEYNTTKRNGFTLIELVVVVSVLAIVGVMVIPSLRTLNEDRKVRDTARVVGAVFAAARERAAVDGQAGVEILSIPNASGTYNLPNMGLVLYQMRAIPSYNGDILNSTCGILPGDEGFNLLTFTGANLSAANIQKNDFIEVNNSGARLLINSVLGNTVTFENLYPAQPEINIPINKPLPFKIYRQPVRIESSAVRLPNNLFLNMALSGFGKAETLLDPNGDLVDDANLYLGRQFHDFENVPPVAHPDEGNYPAPEGVTRIWFAASGAVSLVTQREFVPSPVEPPHLTGVYDYSTMVRPTGPIHLLMCSANRESADLTDLESNNYLRDDNSMWITIDNRTGGVTMGKMANIESATLLNEQIQETRALARDRRSATP